MSINYPSYKIKRRYILLFNFFDKEKIKEKYIEFFGLLDFYKSGILFLEYNDNIIISINKKYLTKIVFILYLLNIKDFEIFKTLAQIKKYKSNLD